MKNSPIGCQFTRKIPSLGDEKVLLGYNPVTENSSAPPPARITSSSLEIQICFSVVWACFKITGLWPFPNGEPAPYLSTSKAILINDCSQFEGKGMLLRPEI